MLKVTHAVLATVIATPEMELSDAEAQKMGEALTKLNEHYQVKTNPKIIAWCGVICVAGTIYVPKMHRAAERRARAKTAVKGRTLNQTQPQTTAAPAPVTDKPPLDIAALFNFPPADVKQ